MYTRVYTCSTLAALQDKYNRRDKGGEREGGGGGKEKGSCWFSLI